MGTYLRTETDSRGDAVDYSWYCSEVCYSDSLRKEPPTETFERGGRYPCGAESDSPDYCATCGAPVGNPLTDEGERYVREYVLDVDGAYRDAESVTRRTALKAEYPWIFEAQDTRRVITESEFERIADNRVMIQLSRDPRYRNAENAEDQAQAESDIEAEIVASMENEFKVR